MKAEELKQFFSNFEIEKIKDLDAWELSQLGELMEAQANLLKSLAEVKRKKDFYIKNKKEKESINKNLESYQSTLFKN